MSPILVRQDECTRASAQASSGLVSHPAPATLIAFAFEGGSSAPAEQWLISSTPPANSHGCAVWLSDDSGGNDDVRPPPQPLRRRAGSYPDASVILPYPYNAPHNQSFQPSATATFWHATKLVSQPVRGFRKSACRLENRQRPVRLKSLGDRSRPLNKDLGGDGEGLGPQCAALSRGKLVREADACIG